MLLSDLDDIVALDPPLALAHRLPPLLNNDARRPRRRRHRLPLAYPLFHDDPTRSRRPRPRHLPDLPERSTPPATPVRRPWTARPPPRRHDVLVRLDRRLHAEDVPVRHQPQQDDDEDEAADAAEDDADDCAWGGPLDLVRWCYDAECLALFEGFGVGGGEGAAEERGAVERGWEGERREEAYYEAFAEGCEGASVRYRFGGGGRKAAQSCASGERQRRYWCHLLRFPAVFLAGASLEEGEARSLEVIFAGLGWAGLLEQRGVIRQW